VGLAEKRAIKEFQTNVFPGLKQKVDEAAGFEVAMEVRWDTIAREETYSSGWVAGWPNIYFQPIIDAFKQICVDEMGKEALKASLQRIVVQNTRDSYSSWWASFEGGTLTLDYMFTNVDAVADRTKVLRDVVEKAL
jgi:hypothetical protein